MTRVAQDIKDRVVNELADEDGHVSAEQLLAEASAEDHPLHSCFEWDDRRAGHAYRMSQARAIIKSVKIRVVRGPTVTISPAFVRTPQTPPQRQGMTAVTIMADSEADALMTFEAEKQRVLSIVNRVDSLFRNLGFGLLDKFNDWLLELASDRLRQRAHERESVQRVRRIDNDAPRASV